MFQIDDLYAEIKRSDHLSMMEIKKIMHTHIDTMGPCIFFITISALDCNIRTSCWIKKNRAIHQVSDDNNIELIRIDSRYLIINIFQGL
jgi:hypothetical protein